MPKIPLYNQGLGPGLESPASSLGPRAASGAFEAPGQALARISDTARKIAVEFGKAEKEAETLRAYNELSTEYAPQIDNLITSPKSKTVDGFNIESGAFLKDAFGQLDLRQDLTSSQKLNVKTKLQKDFERKISVGRGRVFDRYQEDRKVAMQGGLENLVNDAVSNPRMRPSIMADIQELLSASEQMNLNIGVNETDLMFEIAKRDIQVESTNNDFDLTYHENKKADILNGVDEFEKFDANQRGALATGVQQRINYLQTGALVDAEDKAEAVILGIALNGDSSNAVEISNLFEQLNRPDLKDQFEEDVVVGLKSYNLSKDFRLSSFQDVQDGLNEQLKLAQTGPEQDRIINFRVYTKLSKEADIRRKDFEQDPAAYVQTNYQDVFGVQPTLSQNIEQQRVMGLDEFSIKALSGEAIENIASSLNNAETTQDVANVFSFLQDAEVQKHTPLIMRQLRASGISLADNYVANRPGSPLSQLLFLSSRPGALTINRTPTSDAKLRAAILGNETFANQMKSMFGGTYTDFENDNINGSPSDTSGYGSARQEYLNMMVDLSYFLAQKSGKFIGEQDISAPEDFTSFVEQAVKLLDERYSYNTRFPNAEVALRVPKHLSSDMALIESGLASFVDNLTVDQIFYDDPVFEKGTPQYTIRKETYLKEIKDGYGWGTNNNDAEAILVDSSGGLVFLDDGNGNALPLLKSFNDVILEQQGLSLTLEKQAQDKIKAKALRQEAQSLTGLELNRIRTNQGEDAYQDAIERRERLLKMAEALEATGRR